MRAVILLSGGLDSTVMLAMALQQGRECLALSFDYGQRHRVELKSAQAIAEYYQIPLRIISIDPQSFGQSALVFSSAVPKDRTVEEINRSGIPSTYVPARNTLFLAYALGQAEIWNAQEIYIGSNAMDNSPYPDCRPEFFHAFQAMMNVATKQSVEGAAPQLVTPLLYWSKKEIVRQGLVCKAPLHLTSSCYDPAVDGQPCHRCDACILRDQAFQEV